MDRVKQRGSHTYTGCVREPTPCRTEFATGVLMQTLRFQPSDERPRYYYLTVPQRFFTLLTIALQHTTEIVQA
jgi:hypothetical protein